MAQYDFNLIDKAFDGAAEAYGVDADILRGMAYAESGFSEDVISGTRKSSAGAIGMMQFMPQTAERYGVDPLNPVEAVFGAAAYLRDNLAKFGGDYAKAIAAYNWGENRTAFDRDDWNKLLPEETSKYVTKVLNFAASGQGESSQKPLPKGIQPSEAGAGRGNAEDPRRLDSPVPTASLDELSLTPANSGGSMAPIGSAEPKFASVLETTTPQSLVRPEFVQDFKRQLGALPAEKRLAALEAYASQDQSVYGQAARQILQSERAKNAAVAPESMAQAKGLVGREIAPASFKLGGAADPAFVDATPNLIEASEGVTPEQKARQGEIARGLDAAFDAIKRQPVKEPKAERTSAQKFLDFTLGGTNDSVPSFVLETAGDALRGIAQGVTDFSASTWGLLFALADTTGLGGTSFGKVAREAAIAGQESVQNWGNPNDPNSMAQGVARSIVGSLASAGLTGGMGNAALAVMSASSAGNAYTEARAAGKSNNEALERATVNFLAEFWGEKIALPQVQKLFRSVGSTATMREFVDMTADLMKSDMVGEQFTTAVESLYDKFGSGGLNPNMTMSDYLEQVVQTAKSTFMQGMVMGGGSAGINRLMKPQPQTPASLLSSAIDYGVANTSIDQRAIDAQVIDSLKPDRAQAFAQERAILEERLAEVKPTPQQTTQSIMSAQSVDEALAATEQAINQGTEAAAISQAIADNQADERVLSAEVQAQTDAVLALEQSRPVEDTDEPKAIWTGRKGDGYDTAEGAQVGLNNISKRNPSYSWRVEQMPSGKYRIAGYAKQTQSIAPTVQPSAVAGNADGVQPADATIETADVQTQTATETPAQAGLIQQAEQTPEASAAVEPAPVQADTAPGQSTVDAAVQTKMNPTGTLTVSGDLVQARQQLEAAGIKPVKSADGLRVSKKDAARAQEILSQGEPSGTADQTALLQDPDTQRREYMADLKKRNEKRARLIRREVEKNPLREFLGRYGINLKLANEFAPGVTERRKAMVPGHGPIFRKNGLSLDMLAEKAAEEGFTNGEDADALYGMIAQVFRGVRVSPLYAEGVAESEMEARMREAYEQNNAEFDDYVGTQTEDPFGGLTEEEISATGYDSATDAIKAEVDALIAMAESMGIDTETLREDAAKATADRSEQEYYELAKQSIAQAIQESTGGRSVDATDANAQVQQEETEPAGRPDRSQDDGGQSEQDGLTLAAQTAADIEAQQARVEQAENEKAAAERAAERAAAQEEDRKRIAQASIQAASSFELGGDAMQNLTGQGSLLDAPAQLNQPQARFKPAKDAAETVTPKNQGESFTVSIPFFGEVPYRASQSFSAGNAEVVSSRVITTNTKITKNDASVLGLEPKPMVYAWRVSVVKNADGELASVIEAMDADYGRTPDGEVVAYFKQVESPEAVNRIAPAIAKAALQDWRAQQEKTPEAQDSPKLTQAEAESSSGQPNEYGFTKRETQALNGQEANQTSTPNDERIEDVGQWSNDLADGWPAKREVLFSTATSKKANGFYSALARGVDSINANIAPVAGWKDAIKGLVNKGMVKADEVEWTGIYDWLGLQPGKVSKNDVLAYLSANGVQVQEVVLGDTQGTFSFIATDGRRRTFTSMEEAQKEFDAEREWIEEDAASITKNDGEIIVFDGNSQSLQTFTRNEDGTWEDEQGREFDDEDAAMEAAEEVVSIEKAALQESMSREVEGDEAPNQSKYAQYTLPGGKNYREVLLTLSDARDAINRKLGEANNAYMDAVDEYGATSDEAKAAKQVRDRLSNEMNAQPNYRSSHWDQLNVLAHIRLNDRTDADGNRVLFVEEIQSDFGQDAKKKGVIKSYRPDEVQPISAVDAGKMTSADEELFWHFKTPDNVFSIPKSKYAERDAARDYIIREKRINSGGVPDAPFIGKTEGWLNLALKRVITMAVEGGYDKIAFVNGEQSADRYDLSKQVDQVSYSDDGILRAFQGRKNVMTQKVAPEGIEDYIGKEVAKRLLDAPMEDGRRVLMGESLKVGGTGMIKFYDSIVPNAVKALAKKLGGEMMVVTFPDAPAVRDGSREKLAAQEIGAQPGLTITDKMRETVAQGLPLFSRDRSNKRTYTPEQLREAARKSHGNLLDQGEKKGLVKLAGLDELIEQAAKDRAAVTGGDWQKIKQSILRSVQNSESAADIDIKLSSNGDIEGFHDPKTGKSYLNADVLAPDTIGPVLVHEMWHSANRAGALDAINARAAALIKSGKGNPFFDRVSRMLRDASETSDEEHAAYLVRAWEQDTINTPAPVKRWIQNLVAAIRAWMFNKGIVLKSEQLTEADIAAVARMRAKEQVTAAYDKVRTAIPEIDRYDYNFEKQQFVTNSEGDAGVRVVTDPAAELVDQARKAGLPAGRSTIQRAILTGTLLRGQNLFQAVREVGNATVPDNLKNTLYSQVKFENSEAFRRWFGDSKAVDENGDPLVVYHGTAADFTVFRRTRSGEFGPAIYTTDSPREAGEYGVGQQQPGVNIMPVYVSLKNPYTKGVDSFWKEFGRDDGDEAAVARAQEAGYDGVIAKRPDVYYDNESREFIDRGDTLTHYIVFRPEQIKSAIGSNGNYDPTNPDIRYSRAADFSRPDRSMSDVKDKLIYEAQDRFIDLKRMQEAIEQEFGPVDDQFDARTSETLYKGRVSKRINDFHEIEVKPLLQKMARNKVSQRELSDYLLARGAPERNAQIAKINPDMPDGGAGTNSQGELMTTEAANNYIANIDPVRRVLLDQLAGMVDQITAGTRRLMVSEGLEDPKTIQAWERTYQYYVPMMKEEAEQGILAHHIQGKGFSNKGGFSRRAMGSEKEVTNMLAHVVMQRDAVITRAEKNRVGLSLYGLALTADNSDFWTVIRPRMSKRRIMESLASMGIDPDAYENMDMAPTMRVVSKKTGLVEHRPNPLYKNMPNALIVKVQGEDRVILFNEKNKRAMRLVRSLKNDDRLLQIDLAGSIIGKTTRFMASMSTQYNPAFAMVNMARDMTSGMLNLSTTELAGKQLQVLANVPNAIQGIARALSGRGQTEWSQLFDQFQLDGGQTGFREIFANAFEKTKDIEREMKRLEQAGKLTPGAMTHATLDLIDNFNSTIENAVRLSAYKVALDNGMSRPQAAKLARELTVDFNRQGRAGRELSPMYAFLNAAIQGNARTLLTLTSKAGRKIVVGGLALGAMQALMLMLAGFDDDEIPDYTKTNYLIIPTGGKGYALIPMALGFHVLPNTGRVITELLMTGGKNAGKKTYEAFGELVGAFNPLGGGDVLTADGALRTIMPTVLDPLVDLGFNKNFAGNSISKETFPGDARPGFKNVKEATARNASGQIYTGIAKIINRATLGNDYKRGLASPTPEQIRHLSSSIGGGLYREIEKTYDTAMALAYGKEVKPSQIPYGGRWHGEVDDYQVERSRYFENKRKVDETRSQLKLAEKAGDRNAYQAVVDGNKVQASSIKMLASINRSISDLNRMVNENVDDQETLKRIDSERERLMREFNLRIKMMEKQLEDQQQKEKQ